MNALSLDNTRKIVRIEELERELVQVKERLEKLLKLSDEIDLSPAPAPAPPAAAVPEPVQEVRGPVKHDGSESRFRKDANPHRLMVPFRS